MFLRGIPSSTTRDELREKFGGYGNVVSVVIVPSKTHETYTAYVDFDSEAAASKVRAADLSFDYCTAVLDCRVTLQEGLMCGAQLTTNCTSSYDCARPRTSDVHRYAWAQPHTLPCGNHQCVNLCKHQHTWHVCCVVFCFLAGLSTPPPPPSLPRSLLTTLLALTSNWATPMQQCCQRSPSSSAS